MSYQLTSSKETEKSIKVEKMKLGDVGEYWYVDQVHYVLKTYWGLISLTNPQYCWTNPCDFSINPCRPGTVLTLTIN